MAQDWHDWRILDKVGGIVQCDHGVSAQQRTSISSRQLNGCRGGRTSRSLQDKNNHERLWQSLYGCQTSKQMDVTEEQLNVCHKS